MKIYLIFSLFCAAFSSFGSITMNQINNFNVFWPILTKIESNNNKNAVGDNKMAIGIAQIHLNCLIDANKYGKTAYTHKDCFDPEISKIICFNYLLKYSSSDLELGNFERLAKTWNGGCNWEKNSKKSLTVAKNLATYWQKIERELNHANQL